ncbi:MAG: ATP-binding protein [Roseovarius sp.]|uniref:ATP-binding protein n=1 Tax=Roseovarius sp. TaxID=1486281 RepID=UPI0032EBA43E
MSTVPRAARPGKRAVPGARTGTAAGVRLSLTIRATPEATREAVAAVRGIMARAGAAPGLLFRVELVLAEVLNNIGEHAYGGAGGRVWLKARMEGDALCVTIADRGKPMPGGEMPEGVLPDTEVPCERQPEGGFGWYLIHSQVDSLDYCRRDGENILGLRFTPRSGA